MQAFADVVRQGKALYIGVSEWTADQLREGARARRRPRLPADLQPAAVLDALARDRARGRADQRGARHRPDRLVPDRPGRADRQVRAGPAAARGLAGDGREGRRRHDQPLHERRRPGSRSRSSSRSRPTSASRWPSSPWPGSCRTTTSPAAIIGASKPEQVHDNAGASGVTLDADVLKRIDEALGDLPETRRRADAVPGGPPRADASRAAVPDPGREGRTRRLGNEVPLGRQARSAALGRLSGGRTCPRPGPRRRGRRPRPPRRSRSRRSR